MLPGGFSPAAPPLSRRTFNDWPQCGGFGLTSAGACAFSSNVASVSRLGLFSSGLSPAFAGAIPRLQPWVTEIYTSSIEPLPLILLPFDMSMILLFERRHRKRQQKEGMGKFDARALGNRDFTWKIGRNPNPFLLLEQTKRVLRAGSD